jgi:hypothetical protein
MGALARRIVAEESFIIALAGTKSAIVSIEAGAAGLLLAATGYASNTSATFEVGLTADGTFYPVNGASVTLVAGEWVQIPEAVMFGKFIKVVIGAGAAQEETLTLCLKG